jgi:hypothetical protein
MTLLRLCLWCSVVLRPNSAASGWQTTGKNNIITKYTKKRSREFLESWRERSLPVVEVKGYKWAAVFLPGIGVLRSLFLVPRLEHWLSQPRAQMTAFRDMAPCSLAAVDWRFRGPYCLHHQANFLTMEAVRTSETSIYFCETVRRHIPEGFYLESKGCLPVGKVVESDDEQSLRLGYDAWSFTSTHTAGTVEPRSEFVDCTMTTGWCAVYLVTGVHFDMIDTSGAAGPRPSRVLCWDHLTPQAVACCTHYIRVPRDCNSLLSACFNPL